MLLLTLFTGISSFQQFRNFARFGPFKKYPVVVFFVLDKSSLKHLKHNQNKNFKFKLFGIVTLDDLDTRLPKA